MNIECSNCHHFAERRWNRNNTFEIGRCMADKKKRQVVAKDPEVIRKVKCRDYKPIKSSWVPPESKPTKMDIRNVVIEEEKPKKKVRLK